MSTAPHIFDAFADRLKSLRLELCLTQHELAAEFGISVRSLQDYEAGSALPQPARRRRMLALIAAKTNGEAAA